MSRIIVTGGAGFIGSHLVDALVIRGHEVTVIDDFSTGKRENLNPRAKLAECDIRIAWRELLPSFQGIDYVFHCASLPRVPLSFKDPMLTHTVNVNGTLSILHLAASANVKRLIFASSASVYGRQANLPLKEEMIPNPVSPYGVQKYYSEKCCQFWCQAYGLSTVCLRFFNVYGPRQSEDAPVIGAFLRASRSHLVATIDGDGTQSRDFIHISDVIQASLAAMSSNKVGLGEVINIGFGKAIIINLLSRMINGFYNYGPSRPGDIRATLADRTKAFLLLNWEPRVDIVDGIRELKLEN